MKDAAMALYRQMVGDGLNDEGMLARTKWTRAALKAIRAEVAESDKKHRLADAKPRAKPAKAVKTEEQFEAERRMRAEAREERLRQEALEEAQTMISTWNPGTVVWFKKKWAEGTALSVLADYTEARVKHVPLFAASLGLPAREETR